MSEDFGPISEFRGALTVRLRTASGMRRQRRLARLRAVAEAKAARTLAAARENLARRQAVAHDARDHRKPTAREVAETLKAFRNDLLRLGETEQETFIETVWLFLGGQLAQAEWLRAVKALKTLAASR